MKATPSMSKRITLGFIVVVWNQTHNISKVCLYTFRFRNKVQNHVNNLNRILPFVLK